MDQKFYCFTVDDNIRFLKELSERHMDGLFSHPYLAMYRRLHERYGVKIQLNLFYETEGFDLSQMTDRYRAEWLQNSDWLKLSFHSRIENVKPYALSGYDEVYADCGRVHSEIKRFASPSSLGKTTTVHYCVATPQGLQALKDNGVVGLLGLYGDTQKPQNSYQTAFSDAERIRLGEIVYSDGMAYTGIDIILNQCTRKEILARLELLSGRHLIKVMIHEQYFYADYPRYQSDFEEKLDATFSRLNEKGYHSTFFEECL